ncbi:MAG: helix-hairpin-helix domain-containing protein [Bacteroidales bacterium]|nr:helix-hairpin-helix domain-containing protein [Bacteroidales bacterium]
MASFIAFSQQNETNISSYISSIEDAELDDETKATMIEDLYYLLEKPCNLNIATDYQLSLIGLDASQIRNLKLYIKNSGQMLSIYELSVINGFTDEVIEQIKPFICAYPVEKQPPLRLDSIFRKAKHEFRTQYREIVEDSYGYTRGDKGYMGDKFATNFRYNLNYFDRLSFSITADKDAGEPFFDSLQKYGYDSYSIQLTLKKIGIIEQLTLGDYRLNFGEGLAIGQFFDLGHFNNNAQIKRKTNGIQPYRSITEYGFNRGLATQIRVKDFDLYLFGSYNKIDYSGSILTTGYHRTLSEIARKDSNSDALFGLHLNYVLNNFEIGGTWLGYCYKYPISHQNSEYQKDYFTGYNNNITSLNFNYRYRKLLVFSEVAMSKNQALASIFGLEVLFDYKTNLSVSYRDYGKAFQNFYSSAIGTQSNNANEKGVYAAFTHRINKHWHYYLGVDVFHFPHISYRAAEAVTGYKAKAELVFEPNERHLFSVHYRLNNRPYNETHDNGKVYPEDNILNQVQVKYDLHPLKWLTFNVRAGYGFTNTYKNDSLSGFFSLIEAIYTHPLEKLKINIRYAFFNTDNYDNRFNVYEYNLPLNFSTVALYDKGQRAYLNIVWKINKHISLSARYAITIYSDKQEIGSGNDKIDGNKRQDIGCQLHFKV